MVGTHCIRGGIGLEPANGVVPVAWTKVNSETAYNKNTHDKKTTAIVHGLAATGAIMAQNNPASNHGNKFEALYHAAYTE